MHRWVRLSGLILSVLLVGLLGAEAAPWRDPSPHTVRFVTVDDGVRLEVLGLGPRRYSERTRVYSPEVAHPSAATRRRGRRCPLVA